MDYTAARVFLQRRVKEFEAFKDALGAVRALENVEGETREIEARRQKAQAGLETLEAELARMTTEVEERKEAEKARVVLVGGQHDALREKLRAESNELIAALQAKVHEEQKASDDAQKGHEYLRAQMDLEAKSLKKGIDQLTAQLAALKATAQGL